MNQGEGGMGAKVLAAWIAVVVWVAWAVTLVYALSRALWYYHHVSVPIAYALIGLSAIVFVIAAIPSVRKQFTDAPLKSVAFSTASAVVAVISVAAIASGFTWRFIGHGTEPPPPTVTDVLNESQFDSVLAYARRLPYDLMTHGTGDSTLLSDTMSLNDSIVALYTVKAWIAPQRDANLNSEDDLSGAGQGKGRVVARIVVDDTGRIWIPRGQGGRSKPARSDTIGVGYPRLKLPAGVSYVWIDNLKIRDTTGTFRALIIPDRGLRVLQYPAARTSFTYVRSVATIANFPAARWVFQHSSCTNTPCVTNGCCRTCTN